MRRVLGQKSCRQNVASRQAGAQSRPSGVWCQLNDIMRTEVVEQEEAAAAAMPQNVASINMITAAAVAAVAVAGTPQKPI